MRAPIVADQAEFERWLVCEISVQARIRRIHELESRTGYAAQMVGHQLDMLLVVLSRYSDRDPDDLRKAAHTEAGLMQVVREGASLKEKCERQHEEALRRRERDRCRGCSGTCCTGIGSEPCTCEPRDEDEE